MINQEKLNLYNRAKEAYYNGQEIMTDYEFDELEKELGLENKSRVGAKHNPAYTIKHPYIMGSLSKVQIHKNKEGEIEWEKYLQEVFKYINPEVQCIITPKYDGCSFEIYVKNGEVSISSRGDGEFGKDMKNHLISKIPYKMLQMYDEYTLRGEVLIEKKVFEEKYAEEFVNPRSFVSGILNHDYDKNDIDFINKINDLSIVIYDLRIKGSMGWEDYDWTEIQARVDSDSFFDIQSSKDIVRLLPSCSQHRFIANAENLKDIYTQFDSFRHNMCEFALDGIVIKPVQHERIHNTTEARPKDCVAIKFIPMLEETEVTDITWNLGKTGELIPIIWTKPVIMDGKAVKKCSGHNYGYLLEKKVSIGSKIIMSLAGDIIPFLYKVTNTDNFDETKLNIPNNTYIEGDIHLMKILSDKELARMKFINSVISLNIPSIKAETAKKIFDYVSSSDEMTLEFFNEEEKEIPYNILMIKPEDVYFGAGAGKNGQKCRKEFESIIKNLTLTDIIKSLNFRFCGTKVAEQCAEYLINGTADFEHLAAEGYSWVLNETSAQMNQLNKILRYIGKEFSDYKEQAETAKKDTSNLIPVILTGEPNNYRSKGEFLKMNPQYRNTTSWKEVQIVFTNSLDSNTGKMKKAREKNIRIELY